MLRRRVLVSTLALIVAVSFLQINSSAVAQDRYAGRTITGTAYFIGSRFSTRSRSLLFRLIIDRFSTVEEARQLNAALQSGGQDELLRTLSRMKVGRIQIGNDVGVPVNAIIAEDNEGRTKLKVIYERNIRIAELRYGARSTDYRFGYAELYIGRGANEGMLIPAAKIRLRDDNVWEVEDFGTFPARLMGLQVRGGGREDVR
jgi:hypothetical protein